MRKTTATLVGLGVLAFALTGCTPAVSSDGGTAASAPVDAANADCVSAVTPDVEAAMEPSALVAPEAPLDLAGLAGKKIWYITNSQNQFSTEMSTGVEEAGKAAGVDVTVFDGQNSTSRYSEGINQAIAQGADGIILMAVQPAVVKEDLAAAEAAGIKVLSTLNGDPDEPVAAGTFGNLTADYTADGELMGKWALYDSGCAADVVVVQSSPVHVWDLAAKGIEAAITDSGSDSSVKVLDIDPAKIATDTTSQLQTALQVDPDVNYVLPVWDSAMPFISPAIAASGGTAKVLAHDGISASLELIASGKDQQGTVAMPPPGWIGWAAFDEVGRAITGAADPGYVIPTRLVTSDNVGDGSVGDVSPNYADYQTAFTSAWSK
ncbi:sugar ABC transporter substrate-binding protein [Herbiconiux sp.]|uniref:sugar ABC transporter substrate-binding protein n=1 Tax=Herbiconiux sp. TaxID=1871186 RepID=UPI0025BDDADD|nr:sugar ABC transporter substrate-binding protein [Herbiconiux sp.]